MSNPSDFVIENCVLIQYKGKDADVIIPEGVTGISKDAFSKSESIKSISIPKGVKEIAAEAFEVCPSLQTISLPDSITKIGNAAFASCGSEDCALM